MMPYGTAPYVAVSIYFVGGAIHFFDSNTFTELVNMKATTFRRTKDGKYEKVLHQRIHKVLHCKPSAGKPTEARQKTTWNRDVNAAINILMLLIKELEGKPRPDPFVSAQMIKHNHGVEAVETNHATIVATTAPTVILPLPVETGTTQNRG